MVDFEEQVRKFRLSPYIARRTWNGKSEEEKAIEIISYVRLGEEAGYTSFTSYKHCVRLCEFITNNRPLALTSPDSFTRILAESIKNS